MHKNKVFNEYLEDEYNKEEIYNCICREIDNRNIKKKKVLNIVAILFIVILLGSTTSTLYARKSWEDEYKKYEERYVKCINTSINTELTNTNTQKLNMNYEYNDKFGIKLDSIGLTEHKCIIDVNCNINDNDKKKPSAFEFSYAIYDEENNIYIVSERSKFGAGEYKDYKKKLCRELGIQYNLNKNIPKTIVDQFGLNPISFENGNNIMRIDLTSVQGFPKSKKLYIRIFDIGYTLINEVKNGVNLEIIDSEDFVLSDSEWQFEIEIPEQIYDRTYNNIKFADSIENFDLIKSVISSEDILLMTINTKYSMLDVFKGVYISDEDGNIFMPSGASDANELQLLFDISPNNFDKKIYFNLNIPEYNVNKKIELIKEI